MTLSFSYGFHELHFMQKNISGYSNDVVDYLPSHAPVELKTSYIKLFLIDLKPHCNIQKISENAYGI